MDGLSVLPPLSRRRRHYPPTLGPSSINAHHPMLARVLLCLEPRTCRYLPRPRSYSSSAPLTAARFPPCVSYRHRRRAAKQITHPLRMLSHVDEALRGVARRVGHCQERLGALLCVVVVLCECMSNEPGGDFHVSRGGEAMPARLGALALVFSPRCDSQPLYRGRVGFRSYSKKMRFWAKHSANDPTPRPFSRMARKIAGNPS